ncbi:response regulator [Actinomadura sp. SCN-SB]|uniref:response regulator n=1 Tax=Actinomadura sp. SCN-SB TaxID=3373092 RepID=UPI0037512997
MIRVLLAEDQALVRAGFRALLDDEDDIAVVGEVADGAAAVEAARAERPDVVLMDIRMPGMNGLDAARRIVVELPAVRVVILTTFDMDEFVYGAMRAGVAGFLVKDTDPEDLIRAVRVAARGDALISPSVTRRLIAQYAGRAPRPAADPRVNTLTPRERELVTLVAEGLANDEIAERLSLSEATVRSAVSRVTSKLGVRNRAGLVVFAYESALVGPGWAQHEA